MRAGTVVEVELRRPTWLKALIVALVLVILTAPRALAQPAEEPPVEEVLPMPKPHLLLRTGPGELLGPDGKRYLIPQLSHVLTPEKFSELDAELMRLQEAETRLQAENKSLRQSADSVPWLPVVIGVGLGVVAGAYIGARYF